MNSQAIAYQIRRKHKQPEPKWAESVESVSTVGFGDFWLALNELASKPEAQPEIPVILMTLDGEYPVGCVELQQNENGEWRLTIQTDEPVNREPWD